MILGGLLLYPLAKLVIDSVGPPAGIGNYIEFFHSATNRLALTNTLVMSGIVTVLSICFGAVPAWFLHATSSRALKFIILGSIIIPFCLSVILKNYAFLFILGRLGLLSIMLQALGLSDGPLMVLYTPPAVVICMVYIMLPYAFLPLYGAFRTIDPQLVSVAEGLGASRIVALFTVVLPLSVPGLLAAAVLVFVLSLGFYVTPILLGGQGSPFMANMIAHDIFFDYNYGSAAAGGVILLFVAFVSLWGISRLVGKDRIRRAIG